MLRFLFVFAFVFGVRAGAHAESSHLWNDGAGRCLDLVNDGVNDQVRMVSCANVTGQEWELSRLHGPGRAFQLTNRFTGPSRCLEAGGEGLRLRSCDRSPGQRWSGEWQRNG